jgi:hypothetical protein
LIEQDQPDVEAGLDHMFQEVAMLPQHCQNYVKDAGELLCPDTGVCAVFPPASGCGAGLNTPFSLQVFNLWFAHVIGFRRVHWHTKEGCKAPE